MDAINDETVVETQLISSIDMVNEAVNINITEKARRDSDISGSRILNTAKLGRCPYLPSELPESDHSTGIKFYFLRYHVLSNSRAKLPLL